MARGSCLRGEVCAVGDVWTARRRAGVCGESWTMGEEGGSVRIRRFYPRVGFKGLEEMSSIRAWEFADAVR